MNSGMTYWILFVFVSFLLGIGLGIGIMWFIRRQEKALTSQLAIENIRATEQQIAQLKDSFGALSYEALSKNTEEFLKIAREKLTEQSTGNDKQLEHKKELIDQALKDISQKLGKVETTMQTLEKDRESKFSSLTEQLGRTAEETKQLRETAGSLKAALADNRVRGQWGERMAEDVLQLAGFVQGINYQKQKQVTGEGQSIPDYTFNLPQGRKIHMDVKFPLNNYSAYQSAETDAERDRLRKAFLADVRSRIKEVTKRDYINQDTLDYVIVFIPNEQVYSFINEHAQDLLDEAMRQKVILCAPMTLYAILAVIRQAVENFNLSQTAGAVMDLIADFKKQWEMFSESFGRLGNQLQTVQNTYLALNTTRSSQLLKPIDKIEELRSRGTEITTKTGKKLTLLNTGTSEE